MGTIEVWVRRVVVSKGLASVPCCVSLFLYGLCRGIGFDKGSKVYGSGFSSDGDFRITSETAALSVKIGAALKTRV